MEDRIKEVMASVLNTEVDAIDENASPDNIDGWDSLKQMNLIIALEEEFDVRFTDDQVADMLNFKLICMIVSETIS